MAKAVKKEVKSVKSSPKAKKSVDTKISKVKTRKATVRKTLPKEMTVALLSQASADYNPRKISDKQLAGLKTSYDTFGDLSGVVLNRRSGTIVSGHQRLKTLDGRKTRIKTSAHKDKYGTVAVGFIEVLNSDRSITKIPYREVDWNNEKTEKAANIAANAGGGEFDKNKLAALVEELEIGTMFAIETIGLDPLTLKQLKGGAKGESADAPTEFREYDAKGVADELQCKCPKCGFKF